MQEIATQTLHLAKQKQERIKIFLMHIKNPCRMHYQIQNFTLDKTRSNTNSMITTKSMARLNNHLDTQNSLEQSEKSLNFTGNLSKPLIQHQSINSANVSPIRGGIQGSQTSVDNDSQNIAMQNLNSQFARMQSDQIQIFQEEMKESFAQSEKTQKQIVDDNIDLALKTLKSAQSKQSVQSNANNSELVSKSNGTKQKIDSVISQDQKVNKKKEQAYSTQKVQQQFKEFKPLTARDSTIKENLVISPRMQKKDIIKSKASQSREHHILVDDLSNTNFNKQRKSISQNPYLDNNSSLPAHNDAMMNQEQSHQNDKAAIETELKEFIEIENQIQVNHNNSQESSSIYTIVSPTAAYQPPKLKASELKESQKRQRQKEKQGLSLFQKTDQEPNFTFVDSGYISSTKNKKTLHESLDSRRAYYPNCDQMNFSEKEITAQIEKSQSVQSILQKSNKGTVLNQLKGTINKNNNHNTKRHDSKSKERIDFKKKKSMTNLQNGQKETKSDKKNPNNKVTNLKMRTKSQQRSESRNQTVNDNKSNFDQVMLGNYEQANNKTKLKRKKSSNTNITNDPLEQALQKEEQRKQLKKQKQIYYLSQSKKLNHLMLLSLKINLRFGLNKIKSHAYKKSKQRQGLKLLRKTLESKLLKQKSIFILKIASFKRSQSKVSAYQKGLLQLLQCNLIKRVQGDQFKQYGISKLREYCMFLKFLQMQSQVERAAQIQNENMIYSEQISRLKNLNRMFRTRINEIQ